GGLEIEVERDPRAHLDEGHVLAGLERALPGDAERGAREEEAGAEGAGADRRADVDPVIDRAEVVLARAPEPAGLELEVRVRERPAIDERGDEVGADDEPAALAGLVLGERRAPAELE